LIEVGAWPEPALGRQVIAIERPARRRNSNRVLLIEPILVTIHVNSHFVQPVFPNFAIVDGGLADDIRNGLGHVHGD